MNTNTKVLALKYRPQTFEDLIGQDVAVTTIKNSILSSKVPNAYLFTGIRGVGKTTIARLVARALNCLNGLEKICVEKLCQNCEEIKNSNSQDCLEIDGASNTGVDNVRELIEFSRYRPTTSKYKIIIIDEVQMLSKQAFNALLKTLEEPPEYLKFIFCTTEIKKIPVTIVSRSTRLDLPRVKSIELFNFIKKICEKEKGKVSDSALKLIVKISEGSVRDALSLLDRALISEDKNVEIDLKCAQKIFGYFDKASLIELFKFIFEGDEKKTIEIYRTIYDQGIEPKIFLNDFLELLYYFKNIVSLKVEGTNFDLNDEEFNAIKELSTKIESKTLFLFWQFTIKVLEEIDIVSNQNLSIEMFLIRLLHLKEFLNIESVLGKNENLLVHNTKENIESKEQVNKKVNDTFIETRNQTIGQIKNISQEKKILENNDKNNFQIKSFDDLIETCNLKKEIKLKYELETNVNLVAFENKIIEISFNENLDKEFIKDLATKLYDWTGDRWIISLSKKIGELSKKETNIINEKELLKNEKNSEIYKKVLDLFLDAELIDVKIKKNLKND